MSDIVIKAENLGKKYTIGHQEEKGGYTSLRDVLMQNVRTLWNKTRDLATGKPIIQGDTMEEVWALRGVNFEIHRGEAVGIIGRNGAGKSTLLKILSRITEPTTGRTTIKGRVASLLEVGTGFHSELSGRENIYLNGTILGMTRMEIKQKFDEIVAFAEVEKYLDTPVKRYSSGMYVRLAFAVAAHLEPEILVVDEVLAVGDAAFQKKCLGKMGTVAKEGRTVLFVSHNMVAILALCPRVLLITEGHIKRDGISQDVVQDYSGEYEAMASTVPLGERRDRRGNGSIRMVGIRFGTEDNPESGFWATGKDAFIQLSYQCIPDQRYLNIEIALGVRKQDQTPLLYLGTKVVKQDLDLAYGLGSSLCQIKRLPLESGRYSIVTEIKQNGIIVDYVQAAATVDVMEGDYYGTGVIWPYGGFLCDYSWAHFAGDSNDPDR
jgi:lipopolysaccharide transport system ATP-binding protein